MRLNPCTGRQTRTLALAVALLGGLASPLATAEPRLVPHAQGVATVPDTPRNIAVLSVAGLDTLDALDLAPTGVPAYSEKSTVQWPARLIQRYAQGRNTAITVPRGSQDKPYVDTLKTLRPDLIIVEGRSRGLYADVQGIAPTLDLSVSATSFVDSIIQNILALGSALRQERRAVEQAQTLLTQVRALREAGARQGTGLVLFAVGERVTPQAPGARFGMVYDIAGVRPVAMPAAQPTSRAPVAAPGDDPAAQAAAEAARKARAAAEAQALSDIMAGEPDWLFIIDRHAAFGEPQAARIMAATPAIVQSKAWQQKKVVYLDQEGANWYLMAGGLGLLNSAIRQIQAAFDQHSPQPAR